MFQEMMPMSQGGGGGLNYQYAGGVSSTGGSIQVDHDADKLIAIIDMDPSKISQVSVKINNVPYPLSGASPTWDSGVSYSGLGLGYYVISATIHSGDTITFNSSATVGAVIIIV